MRKLLLVLAVVFAASLYTAVGVDAATYSTSKKKMGHAVVTKHKAVKTHHKMVSKPAAKAAKKSMHARSARGPMTIKHKAKWHRVMVCKPKAKKMTKRMARPARYARGPVVTCPAPVVNVPAQAAPVVNVPQGPAPVVNVPASPPTVGITVDNCSIFIVRENQLIVLDKNTYECKKMVPLE